MQPVPVSSSQNAAASLPPAGAAMAGRGVEDAALLSEIYRSTYDTGIFTVDLSGKVTTWNVGAERITGYVRDEILGHDQELIFTPEDRDRREAQQEMQVAETKERSENNRWHLRKDGTRFWADGVLTPLMDEGAHHIGFLKIFRDASERRYQELEACRIANLDALTGLPNRCSLEAHASELIAAARRSGQQLALHLLDLDSFKQVNDVLGHHVGDRLLQQAAERIRKAVRGSDFVARLEGDEFALLQPYLWSTESAGELAGKLNQVLSEPYDVDGQAVRIGASIGIAFCPHDAVDLDQLFRRADLALYRAKQEGKGSFHLFTDNLQHKAQGKNQRVTELEEVVARREFYLVYQPKIGFATGHPMAVEALLRCSNPGFSGMPVESLVDRLIAKGLMQLLSPWILREACNALKRWKDQGMPSIRMCINLSADDFTGYDLEGTIDSIVSELGLNYEEVEIELTERHALNVGSESLPSLQALYDKGVRVALDDFGTGFSALSHLKNLPVTTVKLDKSFLSRVPEDEHAIALVKGVMQLLQSLGLETVGEGVETPAQEEILRECHCTAYQGFLLSRPMALEQITDWLAARC